MVLTSEQIKSAVSGAVRYGSDGKYISFYRFTEEQEGLFSAGYMEDSMSAACVVIDFETDAFSLSLNWRIKKNLAGGRLLNDLCIDGLYAASFGIDGDNTACGSGDFSFALPAGIHRVQIYLCHIALSEIADISLECASVFKPAAPKRKMLCMGDSITQGHGTEHPSMTYAARLGKLLDVSVVNKGVGGMCFNAGLLEACGGEQADIITLAYGTNDWCSRTREDLIAEIDKIKVILSKSFKGAEKYIITPLWRTDMNTAPLCLDRPAPCGDFSEMTEDIKKEFSGYSVIDGMRVFPHVKDFFSDKWLHPGDFGSVLLADNITAEIERNRRCLQ